MPRFITGDELGNIKALQYSPEKEIKVDLRTIYDGSSSGKIKGIQALSVSSSPSGEKLIASAHADGSASIFHLHDDDQVELLHDWKETRLKSDQTYVGLSASTQHIFSCTSNGALRSITLAQDEQPPKHELASLPTRLCDWRIASNQETFAYGGDEVELSVWDTEKAFTKPLESTGDANVEAKKRKRNDTLLHGEIWRGKNVPNDGLGLRQPVHITSLTYLSQTASSSQHHLLTGTSLGDVRRYDTRAARRPVVEWKGVGKLGGIKKVEKGFAEHEVFVSDKGSNLFSLDLRNGGVLCGYKGLSGAITSIAPSPTFLASTALDRFARIHSTSSPPEHAGEQVEKKGEVLEKVYTKSIPTVIVWNGDVSWLSEENDDSGDDSEDDDVWDGMEDVGISDDDEDIASRRKRAKNKATG